uniref:GDNF/GAS1 domain-containing protein n=1 Tax=Anopheles minimus TaxID=112268 RepID=A0A182VS72_9DIPT
MGVDDNYHRLLDQNMALIETPLVAPPHAYYPQHYKTALYPYNVSGYHHLHQHGAGGHFGYHQHQHQHSYGGFEYEYATGGGVGGGIGGPGTGGYLASSAGSAPVDNVLISSNGGNGDAAIELDGSSYEHTVDKQFAFSTTRLTFFCCLFPIPNKTVGSDDIEEKEAEMSFIHFQSTCHLALDSCRDDQVCSSALKTVLMHCDQHRCNRNACMESLQSFYKSIHDDLSLDIAFCLCRKTPNRHDSCMIAQEKLHPVCAQRPPESLSQQSAAAGNGITYNAPPACHAVAELCREDEDCRARLEVFEQSCAVDSVTKKCAGKTSACRQAMLGILGTPLRTTCACQGSDMQQLYDCLGWQRLLWLNPCVVESQKDFHLKRLAELGLLTTTTTMATTTTTLATTTTMRTTRVTPPPTLPPTKPKPVYRPKPTEMHTIETNYVETPDTRPETLVHNQNGVIERSDIDRGRQHPPPDEYDRSSGTRHQSVDTEGEEDMAGQYEKEIYQRPDEQVLHVASTEVQEVETLPPTTVTTTTTEPTTTPVPIRYCVVQRSHQPDQLIAEGKSRRLYILDDAECSELCTCGGGDSLALTCHALCVPLAPCRTALAYYSHAAPAYQAFRGRCLCYSGRFICMRPPPGEYQLPGGIFLLLGYSSTDEALLRPHTNLGVQDAVRALQQYVLQHIDNSTLCTLTLFNITEENIILSIRLPLDPKLTPMQLLKLEKDQCTRILESISHQINTQYVELSAHRLLSIFKMAEVQIVWPEVSYARRHSTPSLAVSLITGVATVLLTLCGTLLPPFVRWAQHHQRWLQAPPSVT